MTAAAVLRQATATQRSGFVPLLGLRPAAGLVAGLAIGVGTGHVVAGVTLAAGAIPVGVASLVGRFKAPVIMLVVTCLATGVSTFLGSLTSNVTWLHIAVLALWGFAAGLLVALGPVTAVVATQAVVAFVVFGRFPLPVGHAADQGLLVAAGGLIQVVLVSTVRSRGRFRTERRATGAAYAALAALALADDVPGSALPAAEALAEATAAVDRSWAGPGSTAREVFRELLLEAGRIRLDLVALAGARTRLVRLGAGSLVAELDGFRRGASARLAAVGAAVVDGADLPESVPDAPLEVPDDRETGDFEAYATWWFATSRMAAIAGQLRAAARMTVPRDRHHTRGRPTPPDELRAALGVLRANLDPASVTFRHATRLAVALPVGAVLAHLLADRRGYWVPLTIMIVLKPNFATTTSRGVARVLGTAVGVGLASLVADALHPVGWDLVVLVGVLAAAMMATLSWNYGVFAIFNAATVVFLISAADPEPTHIAVDRLLETGIGGAIAFVAFLVWPAWQGDRLAPLVRNLLAAQGDYLGAALDLVAGTAPIAEVRRAGDRARLARTNTETVLQRVDAEPASRRGDPETARALLGAAGRMVRAGHEIAALGGEPLPVVRPFRRDVVSAIGVLAAAVGSEGGAAIGDLRAAHARMVGVLAAPTGDRDEDARRAVLADACDQVVDSVDLARDVLRGSHRR